MHHEAAAYDLIRAMDGCGNFDEIEVRADIVQDQIYALVVSIKGQDDPEHCDQVAQQQVQRLFGGSLRYDGWGAGMGWYEVFFYRKDPKRKEQWDAGDYTSINVGKNTDPRSVRSNPAGRHLPCGDLPDKQCRQLQHVYESARKYGASKKSAAKQAWSTVNRTLEGNPMSKQSNISGPPARHSVKIFSRHPSYDSAIKAARKKSRELGQSVFVDALLREHDEDGKPWAVWTFGETVGYDSPEKLFGRRNMETLVEAHLKKNPEAPKSNPKTRVKYPYMVWQHSTTGRWFVSHSGQGNAVTSVRGYDTPQAAEDSAYALADKRGEKHPIVERRADDWRAPNPSAPDRAMILAQRLARGES